MSPQGNPAKGGPLLTVRDLSQDNVEPTPQADTGILLGRLAEFTEPEAQGPMRGFSLQLGDSSRWWIAGSRGAAFPAKKIGAIMQLRERPPGDGPLMFFYEKHEDHRSLELSRLRAQGWLNLYQTHYQIFFHPRLHHALCEYDATLEEPHYAMMSLSVHVIHWGSILRGGLPFHAALLEHQGQGVVLAAPGGTGKSTCSRRVPPPWRARCDDEVLTVLSPEGRYLAHPFPTWTDYLWKRGENTWKVEEAVPLAGIFFLEQSSEDDCVPLKSVPAAAAATRSADEIMRFKLLGNSETWEVRELRRNIFMNACDILKQVPAFRLRVRLSGRFWEKIEAALGWR
jgi:SynChlorMet cassette protein ScmC